LDKKKKPMLLLCCSYLEKCKCCTSLEYRWWIS